MRAASRQRRKFPWIYCHWAKKPQFRHEKIREHRNTQEWEMLRKLQVWAKRWYLMAHQPAPPCTTQVQKTFMCSLAHGTGSSSLFNPLFPSPCFFPTPLYQHWPNSSAPRTSLLWHFRAAGRTQDFGDRLLCRPQVPLHQETWVSPEKWRKDI